MSFEDIILNGVHIGEHLSDEKDMLNPNKVIEEIQNRCINDGMNYAIIRTSENIILPERCFYEWADFLAKHKIYFMFLYTYHITPKRKFSQLNEKIVSEIKKIAGQYFLGDVIGEMGSMFACKSKGYYDYPYHAPMPIQNAESMQTAKDNYIKSVSQYTSFDKSIGIPHITSVDATILNRYNLEAGATIPVGELMVGNPEILIASVRGTAKAYRSKMWGTYIAHEWYGGMRHEDTLKQKRLSLAYKYAYISGSNMFCLESGDEAIESYGYCYSADHPICQQYRDVIHDFNRFIKQVKRPAGGPKVKIAFIHGNLDGWGGVPFESTVWCQFNGKQWGHSSAEYSWRILEDIESPTGWYNPANFGERDFSAGVPFGMYDILPAEADLSVMSQYECLIFAGWHTMTESVIQKLEAYVENGGWLFITAAHLNTNPRRDGEFSFIRNGRLERLLGCELKATAFLSADGVKFVRESIIPEVMYPAPADYRLNGCDPLYAGGYKLFADITLAGGNTAGVLSDRFFPDECSGQKPILIENKLGKGFAVLLTTADYPGANTVYPLYRTIVRQILSAINRTSSVKVCANGKIKYAVYEGDLIYLLNTDYDCAAQAVVIREEQSETVTLEPCELKILS